MRDPAFVATSSSSWSCAGAASRVAIFTTSIFTIGTDRQRPAPSAESAGSRGAIATPAASSAGASVPQLCFRKASSEPPMLLPPTKTCGTVLLPVSCSSASCNRTCPRARRAPRITLPPCTRRAATSRACTDRRWIWRRRRCASAIAPATKCRPTASSTAMSPAALSAPSSAAAALSASSAAAARAAAATASKSGGTRPASAEAGVRAMLSMISFSAESLRFDIVGIRRHTSPVNEWPARRARRQLDAVQSCELGLDAA